VTFLSRRRRPLSAGHRTRGGAFHRQDGISRVSSRWRPWQGCCCSQGPEDYL